MDPRKPKYVCLVTVHGIGFQQAPKPPIPGYADELHAHLKALLGDELGEDDDVDSRGCGGPVYVASEVDGSHNDGLKRLKKEQLVKGGRIAHVALVYSRSEDLGPQLGATIEASIRALLTFRRYTTFFGVLGIIGRTVWGLVRQGRAKPGPRSSLAPRVDLPRHAAPADAALGDKPPPRHTILLAIQQDIAAYVCRNDLRERVRGFVQEALQLLLVHPEVDVIVVNAHSQGTVLCWDVLCRLPLTDDELGWKERIRAFVTAGSPIRKYVDVFSWGHRVGQMQALRSEPLKWHNFWDECDPVADRLEPTPLVAVDPGSGAEPPFPIKDERVNNVRKSSGGGLQAHDYWNNVDDFVKPLAKLLEELAAEPGAS